MDLKKFLKALKLNESSISMILGALVIIVVGILVVNYLKDRGVLLRNGGLTTSEKTTKTHVVTKGETLWSISEKYYGNGFAWVDIAKTNNISIPNLIEVGQTLEIPETGTKVATAANSIQGSTYTTVKGDHLWGIAVRAYGDGYKWVDIARANNLKNPNLLFVGAVLTLPR